MPNPPPTVDWEEKGPVTGISVLISVGTTEYDRYLPQENGPEDGRADLASSDSETQSENENQAPQQRAADDPAAGLEGVTTSIALAHRHSDWEL